MTAKNENGRTNVMFAESKPTKMRISPIKLQGRMVIPRLVATSEKNEGFEELISRRPSKAMKS